MKVGIIPGHYQGFCFLSSSFQSARGVSLETLCSYQENFASPLFVHPRKLTFYACH